MELNKPTVPIDLLEQSCMLSRLDANQELLTTNVHQQIDQISKLQQLYNEPFCETANQKEGRIQQQQVHREALRLLQIQHQDLQKQHQQLGKLQQLQCQLMPTPQLPTTTPCACPQPSLPNVSTALTKTARQLAILPHYEFDDLLQGTSIEPMPQLSIAEVEQYLINDGFNVNPSRLNRESLPPGSTASNNLIATSCLSLPSSGRGIAPSLQNYLQTTAYTSTPTHNHLSIALPSPSVSNHVTSNSTSSGIGSGASASGNQLGPQGNAGPEMCNANMAQPETSLQLTLRDQQWPNPIYHDPVLFDLHTVMVHDNDSDHTQAVPVLEAFFKLAPSQHCSTELLPQYVISIANIAATQITNVIQTASQDSNAEGADIRLIIHEIIHADAALQCRYRAHTLLGFADPLERLAYQCAFALRTELAHRIASTLQQTYWQYLPGAIMAFLPVHEIINSLQREILQTTPMYAGIVFTNFNEMRRKHIFGSPAILYAMTCYYNKLVRYNGKPLTLLSPVDQQTLSQNHEMINSYLHDRSRVLRPAYREKQRVYNDNNMNCADPIPFQIAPYPTKSKRLHAFVMGNPYQPCLFYNNALLSHLR